MTTRFSSSKRTCHNDHFPLTDRLLRTKKKSRMLCDFYVDFVIAWRSKSHCVAENLIWGRTLPLSVHKIPPSICSLFKIFPKVTKFLSPSKQSRSFFSLASKSYLWLFHFFTSTWCFNLIVITFLDTFFIRLRKVKAKSNYAGLLNRTPSIQLFGK